MVEGVTLNVTGNFNAINLSSTGNVYISGGRITVPINSYTHSAIYLNPSTGISSDYPIVVKEIDLHQDGDGSGNGIFIETPDNGDSITWARFSDMVIDNFNKSIYLESTAPDGNSYINAIWFNNIVGKGGSYLYYINESGGNDISGNKIMGNALQCNSRCLVGIYARGLVKQNYIEFMMWDEPASTKVIDFDSSAEHNLIIGPVKSNGFTDDGNNIIINWENDFIYGVDESVRD